MVPGSPVGSAVGPAAARGSQLPFLLRQRAPVREDSGPVCSLGSQGGESPVLYRVGKVGCYHRLRSSETSG